MRRHLLCASLALAGSAWAASNPPPDAPTSAPRPRPGTIQATPATTADPELDVQVRAFDPVTTKAIEFTGNGLPPQLADSIKTAAVQFTGNGLPPSLPASVTTKPMQFTGGSQTRVTRPPSAEARPQQRLPVDVPPPPPDDTDIR